MARRDEGGAADTVIAYEKCLAADLGWAMREGSRHFDGESAVYRTLRRITARLDELGVDYAVAGGMALFSHGLRRFTEDVDILVTEEGLRSVHAQLEGRGYLPPFAGSRNLRDTETGVRIEFLVSGQYPGDGKPKPVVFPEPAAVALEQEGIRFVSLPSLIELKLASGMTAQHRLKDLADVQELIRLLALPEEYAEQLSPFVRGIFFRLWSGVHQAEREAPEAE